MATNNRIAGLLAVMLAAALWGTTGTLQALLPDTREPLVVGAVRLLVAGVFMTLLVLLRPGGRERLGRVPWGFALLAGTTVLAYNLLFFKAVDLAGVGVGTAIALGSAPAWVTLYDLLRGRVPGLAYLLAQACAILGAVILVAGEAGSGSGWLGFLLAALAGASYAAYALITGRIAGTTAPDALAAVTFGSAAVMALPIFLLMPVLWTLSAEAWPILLILGALSTGVAYLLYTWGLAQISISSAVTLTLLEPLTAWILAITVVGEGLTGTKIIGALLVFIGLGAVTVLSSGRQSGNKP